MEYISKQNLETAVFFDLDGTIINLNVSRSSLEKLRAEMIYSFRDKGLSPQHTGIFQMYHYAQKYSDNQLIEKLNNLIGKTEISGLKNYKIKMDTYEINNIISMYNNVKLIGIITNNGNILLKKILEKNTDIAAIFNVLVAREDVTEIKPSGRPIATAIKKNTIEKVVFVGDSISDYQSLVNYCNKTKSIGIFHYIIKSITIKIDEFSRNDFIPAVFDHNKKFNK